MSRILEKTKKKYKNIIFVEIFVFLFIFTGIAFFYRNNTIDLLLGFICAAIPFILFVYVVFFRSYAFSEKLKVFYLGETVKFLTTIFFIIVCLKWFTENNIIFLTSFFITIIINNLLPFLWDQFENYCFKTKD